MNPDYEDSPVQPSKGSKPTFKRYKGESVLGFWNRVRQTLKVFYGASNEEIRNINATLKQLDSDEAKLNYLKTNIITIIED
jgi:hypothetical protein